MKLTHKQKDNLFNFEGYGNRDAPIWFLGMEEKLPKDAPANEFETRAEFDPIMDLYEAHVQLGRPVGTKKISQVWQWMAKIARKLGSERASDWEEKERARHYIISEKKLGAKNGEVFLTELSPIPASAHEKDGWSDLHDLRQRRIDQMRNWLKQNSKLEFLFAYGKGNWKEYCHILDDLTETELTTIKGTDDRVRIKRTDTGTIILLPFPGNGRISTENVRRLFEELDFSR